MDISYVLVAAMAILGVYIFGPSYYRGFILNKPEGDLSEYEGKAEAVFEDTNTNP